MAPDDKRRKKRAVKTDETEEKVANGSPYPGFVKWETSTELIDGGQMALMSKYDAKQSQFTQSVIVKDDDAFTLQPLVISDGPLKGRRVLMLEPVRFPHFRFLDLPAEIRTMVYEELFVEDDSVHLSTFKTTGIDRRIAGPRFPYPNTHKGLKWDDATCKWLGQPPSPYAMLRVSRQIQREAAPIAYGNNVFEIRHFPYLRLFLDTIGDMTKHLRRIKLWDDEYHVTVAASVFNRLKDAKKLRSFAINHETLCELGRYQLRTTTMHKLLSDSRALMKVLQKVQKTSDTPINVLDIIKLEGRSYAQMCEACQRGENCVCFRHCNVGCKDYKKHVEDLNSKFRRMLAADLDIVEDVSSEVPEVTVD